MCTRQYNLVVDKDRRCCVFEKVITYLVESTCSLELSLLQIHLWADCLLARISSGLSYLFFRCDVGLEEWKC